jgi:hypothetical protein
MYTVYINFLIAVKVLFTFMLVVKKVDPTRQVDRILYRVERVFDILILLLLIFLFAPWNPKMHKVDHNTCVLVAVYAVYDLLQIVKN